MSDWYTKRQDLRSGMVFKTTGGDIVRLDRRVPGDGTQWYVDDWDGHYWSSWDNTIEPGDLEGTAACCPDAMAKESGR